MTQRTGRKRKRERDETPGPGERVCDRPDCSRAGRYRAPQDRHQLQVYFWFCLDHVREYNRHWNYIAGLSEDDVEAEIRRDAVWHRPSWTFSSAQARRGAHTGRAGARDAFGFFDAEQDQAEAAYRQWRAGHQQGRQAGAEAPAERSAEAEAFAELELAPGASFEEVRRRYRRLVKLHHPDNNGGCKEAEQRLKRINRAYATLKARYKAQSPA